MAMDLKAAALLRAALDVETIDRAAFLRAQCAGDAVLVQKMEALLAQVDSVATDAAIALPPLSESIGGARVNPDRSGQLVGAFRLLREIGSGGMGAVWLAEREGDFKQQVSPNKRHGKLVAIKWLHVGMSHSARSRFARERELLAQLEHPGIARVVDGGIEAGADWYAMEYVEGQDLKSYSDTQALGLRPVLELLMQICDAVQYAHQHLIVHRDLKPSNIIVDHGGKIKLLDFGVAKDLTDIGITASAAPMTFAYAAPEQIKNQTISTQTDVYALGVILYELLTGSRPHKVQADNPLSLLQAITDTDATAPSHQLRTEAGRNQRVNVRELRGDLDTIVLKALNRDPARRYASALALKEDLARFLADLPINARPDSFSYRTRKWLRRNRVLASVAGAALIAILSLSVYAMQQAQIANRERVQALSALEAKTLINDHYVALFGEALGKGKTLTQEELFALISEVNPNLPGDNRAQKRTLLLHLVELSRLRYDQALTQRLIEAVKPLMDDAALDEKKRFEVFQNLVSLRTNDQHLESQAVGDMLGLSQPSMLILKAKLTRKRGLSAAKQGDMDEAMKGAYELSKRAIEISETTNHQNFMHAALLGNAAEAALDAGDFAQSTTWFDAAFGVWQKAGQDKTFPAQLMQLNSASLIAAQGLLEPAQAMFDKMRSLSKASDDYVLYEKSLPSIEITLALLRRDGKNAAVLAHNEVARLCEYKSAVAQSVVDKSVSQVAQSAVDKSVSQVAQSAVDKSVSQVAQSAVDKSVSQVAQGVVDKSVSQVAQSLVESHDSEACRGARLFEADAAILRNDYQQVLRITQMFPDCLARQACRARLAFAAKADTYIAIDSGAALTPLDRMLRLRALLLARDALMQNKNIERAKLFQDQADYDFALLNIPAGSVLHAWRKRRGIQ
jgi:serine/threonine protein kinase